MAINIYELLGLTMEKFSDFVSRYDAELNSFLSEFEDNTESLFIDYQKAYLNKMNQDIIEDVKKLDFNDSQSELIFNLYEKKLSTNRRILEFLDNRLNAPQKVVVPELKGHNEHSGENEEIKPQFKTQTESVLFHIFEFTPYDKHLIINENEAVRLANDYGWTSKTSGQQFQEHYNKLIFPNNRTNVNEIPNKKSLTTRISYYNNIIEKLSVENKTPALKELEILNSLYHHYKFN